MSERWDRGLEAYASQFGIDKGEVEAWFAERFGDRFGPEAINAAGGAWGDGALSLRDRSLVVVTALIALGGVESRLGRHVQWALDHGVTEAELEELVAFLAVYVGFPRASMGAEVVHEELARRNDPG